MASKDHIPYNISLSLCYPFIPNWLTSIFICSIRCTGIINALTHSPESENYRWSKLKFYIIERPPSTLPVIREWIIHGARSTSAQNVRSCLDRFSTIRAIWLPESTMVNKIRKSFWRPLFIFLTRNFRDFKAARFFLSSSFCFFFHWNRTRFFFLFFFFCLNH